IGGGGTGTGVLRDLAMRGFKALLVEKGDLAHGTTGRYHGLLHSGGRYVIKDPQAARECIEENYVLRRIMPHCIEDTGGFFVITPWDDPGYAARFIAGCQTAGIPVEEIPVSQMLREEPLLNPRITRCFRVPDASADSFLAADANAESARQYGAESLHYHQAVELLRQGDRIHGARCLDLVQNEQVEILADLVINASGAWAGQIAALAGALVSVIPGKGVMVAMNHRLVNTVINRCKIPSDGDILVPAHTVSIIGTTDVKVSDPDRFSIEPWEIHLMLEEGEKLVPGFKEMRMLRAWAGVRPLYQEENVQDTRDVTRAYVLIDHEQRHGFSGLITITSGKWTTYRKMAEATVDLACQKLGVQRPCRTHLEELPRSAQHAGHYLGMRLAQVEEAQTYGQLVCECELATYQDVARAIVDGNAQSIDDVRRDVRLGMGPCQGGFCTYRVAGMLHKLRNPPVQETNAALRDFLQERWKGLLPILWGQQLRQERLDELIYLSLLNADHLPGPTSTPISPQLYEPPYSDEERPVETCVPAEQISPSQQFTPPSFSHPRADLLVIGAGLSGLTAAWQAAKAGRRTRVIAKGRGALYWHSGCIDILGYEPGQGNRPVESPIESLQNLASTHPDHPYTLCGIQHIQEALQAFQELCAQAGYPLYGDLSRNWLLPSALGVARPTCLAPESMISGDLHRKDSMLIVGFEGFPDFYPELIAANLALQGVAALGLSLDLPALKERRFVTGRVLADLFETAQFQGEVARALQASLGGETASKAERVGFPAVLGLRRPLETLQNLREQIGLPVFEIPTLPPSIPGMRLHNLLVSAIEAAGGHVYDGMQVIGSDPGEEGSLAVVWTEAASRRKAHRAEQYVLATGGILGGGLVAHYEGHLQEVACDLPIQAPADRHEWLQRQFLAPVPHPIFTAGISVNQDFQPVSPDGTVCYQNVYAAGTGLAGADALGERSFDGIALATGYLVGKKFAGTERP
ncbi:MAG: anaerobic glycerol-3-phosphate dehydrogenase subunit A, partial [Anaerolineales bacterium]|nr:anaerobic glycerol-3-phosphate dehydrogenase subunit A [Anaerolineales bacterium]